MYFVHFHSVFIPHPQLNGRLAHVVFPRYFLAVQQKGSAFWSHVCIVLVEIIVEKPPPSRLDPRWIGPLLRPHPIKWWRARATFTLSQTSHPSEIWSDFLSVWGVSWWQVQRTVVLIFWIWEDSAFCVWCKNKWSVSLSGETENYPGKTWGVYLNILSQQNPIHPPAKPSHWFEHTSLFCIPATFVAVRQHRDNTESSRNGGESPRTDSTRFFCIEKASFPGPQLSRKMEIVHLYTTYRFLLSSYHWVLDVSRVISNCMFTFYRLTAQQVDKLCFCVGNAKEMIFRVEPENLRVAHQ